ncbi:MAG: plasmid stabilization protein [Verrucomicrobiae bacterium]|nr:plasmid stabilization protein [Verrucomicrobiae bacterium]
MKHQLLTSPAFLRSAKRYLKKHPAAATELETLLECLTADPFAPALRTHKLKGALAGSWASSGGYDLRVVFHLTKHRGHAAIALEAVGAHDEVY